MEDAAQTHHTAQGDVVHQIDESTQACKKDLSSFAEECKSNLQEVSAHVSRAVKDDYAIDDDKDNVPEKRSEDPPQHATIQSLRAPSIETMSRKFRATLEDEEDVPDVVHQAEEQDEENLVPNTEDIAEPSPPISAIKHVATRKRSRTTKLDPEDESPSKLKAAFEQGERRRRGRSTKS
jgi:hypothetical protein